MARSALIALAVLLTGCQVMTSAQVERLRAAAVQEGIARANASLPEDLPADCKAHVARVYPKVGEKGRWTQERWLITSDNRDRRADNCDAWWGDFRAGMNNETMVPTEGE